jgi:hypothetical protein
MLVENCWTQEVPAWPLVGCDIGGAGRQTAGSPDEVIFPDGTRRGGPSCDRLRNPVVVIDQITLVDFADQRITPELMALLIRFWRLEVRADVWAGASLRARDFPTGGLPTICELLPCKLEL